MAKQTTPKRTSCQLNFQPHFAALVEAGTKLTTIRKSPREPGVTLHLFTAQRTKECRKIGTAVCTSCVPIVILGRWPAGRVKKHQSWMRMGENRVGSA